MAAALPKLLTWIARRHPRVEPLPSRPVEVHVMGAESLDVLRACDISQGGVSVSVAHGFAGFDLAASVHLVIKLPGVKAFSARGVIRHANRRPGLFGIEFVELDAEAKQHLSSYIEHLTAIGRAR